MPLPPATPKAPSSTGKVTCTCGRIFKTDSALQQHQRDSSLHQRSNTVEDNQGIKCSCGKTVRNENGLSEHMRNSSHLHKLEEFCAVAGTGTTVGHIPEGSGAEKVADRLREKEKLHESLQYANFRNKDTFPTFAGLPGDTDINMPRKHWCFLAEIIDIEQFIRVKLIVRDKAGTTVLVAFYTDGGGTEFPPSQLHRGYTVAILYARQHDFLDLTTGIRQEEYCTVKVIPVALTKLLQLSDRVHQYSTELDGKRTCHGCDEKKMSLQKCGKCSLFSYCNKSCQAAGWNNRSHKSDCKLISDNDLQAMFLLDWGHFENFIRFPLQDTITTKGQGKIGYIQPWKRQVEALQSKPAIVESPKKAEEGQKSYEHIKHSLGKVGRSIGPPPPPPPPPPPGGLFKDPNPNFTSDVATHGSTTPLHGGVMQFSPAFPPTYRGFVLRKAPDSVSWSRVIRREFLVSDDMVDKTKLSRRNRPVEEIYDALSLNQRGQIDQLVAQANLDETNPLAEWKFASIEFSRRTHGFGKVIKATQIRVILKKVPRIHPNPRVQQAAKEYAVTGRDR